MNDLLHPLPETPEQLIRVLETPPPKDGDLDRHDILEWASAADAFSGTVMETLEDVAADLLAEWLVAQYDSDEDDLYDRLHQACIDAGCGR
ncbi:MAG: hypothetical protein KC503_19395 [Myxococcales bacterium]|nr:hypothetical protein [Myxococcales bacterium]